MTGRYRLRTTVRRLDAVDVRSPANTAAEKAERLRRYAEQVRRGQEVDHIPNSQRLLGDGEQR